MPFFFFREISRFLKLILFLAALDLCCCTRASPVAVRRLLTAWLLLWQSMGSGHLGFSSSTPGEGNGTPLQCSCLENPMAGGAWWAAVHGVAKSRTRLSNFTFTFHFHASEEEMATHFSVLAWRIPGTVGPGGLPSMESHRVGPDWSDLAAAAATAGQGVMIGTLHSQPFWTGIQKDLDPFFSFGCAGSSM